MSTSCKEKKKQDTIRIKENELYQEAEIYLGETKIGEMEVDLKGRMLSRLVVFEPYQNKGYGQQIVQLAKERYGCNCLWVRADNDRAIHVYEKLGFVKTEPTMYLMENSDVPDLKDYRHGFCGQCGRVFNEYGVMIDDGGTHPQDEEDAES